MPAVFGEGARGGIRVAEQLTAIKRSIQPIRHDFDSEFVFGNGARRGIRTPDRLIKSQLLYQLSYAGTETEHSKA